MVDRKVCDTITLEMKGFLSGMNALAQTYNEKD